MNTFILNFHPTRDSMVRNLTARGFEVWTANLRGQGGSRAEGGTRDFGFKELALVDLPIALTYALQHTRTNASSVHAVGASLGATFLYTYLAHNPSNHVVGSLVSIGGPLRWDQTHPLLKIAFQSPHLAGAVKVKGTRQAARAVLPIVKRIPKVLEIYMNANRIDLSKAHELVKTIDDPVPYLNRQIAHWVRDIDLKVAGKNITLGMRDIDIPTLCVVANADGIVPPAAVLSIQGAIGTSQVDVLNVGNTKDWFAHADLFISDLAPEEVFEPLGDWIFRH